MPAPNARMSARLFDVEFYLTRPGQPDRLVRMRLPVDDHQASHSDATELAEALASRIEGYHAGRWQAADTGILVTALEDRPDDKPELHEPYDLALAARAAADLIEKQAAEIAELKTVAAQALDMLDEAKTLMVAADAEIGRLEQQA